jgi:hypothetical protein
MMKYRISQLKGGQLVKLVKVEDSVASYALTGNYVGSTFIVVHNGGTPEAPIAPRAAVCLKNGVMVDAELAKSCWFERS